MILVVKASYIDENIFAIKKNNDIMQLLRSASVADV